MCHRPTVGVDFEDTQERLGGCGQRDSLPAASHGHRGIHRAFSAKRVFWKVKRKGRREALYGSEDLEGGKIEDTGTFTGQL